MEKKDYSNIAIIFGKEENTNFNRYSFPILGRPVCIYPMLAALHTEKINAIYLSSDSQSLLNIGRNIEGVRLLEREVSQPTLTEEVQIAVNLVIEDFGVRPATITILLANSPCVNSEYINDAITFLENNVKYDSVVTAMKRVEFNSQRLFSLNKSNQLIRKNIKGDTLEDAYFLDKRIMVIKTDAILNYSSKSNYFEGLLGENIHPMIQQEGIWDIDYVWQVPIVERWLRQNGFSETESPYHRLEHSGIEPDNKIDENHNNFSNKDRIFHNILITTLPFAEKDSTPIRLLDRLQDVKYIINPVGRKLKESELIDLVKDFECIIAGTEPITRKVMESGLKLKMISRVGIGLDNVDLKAAKELGISVTYTPDAPSPAVAELTIAHMINLLRRIPFVDRKIRSSIWQRIHGERLANMKIGIIGTGRIGSRVLQHLQGFNPRKIFVNDIKPNYSMYEMYHAEHVDKETIFKEADIISLHIPLNRKTRNLITLKEIGLMKKGVYLINTSRGGIINESDLFDALSSKRIAGAAMDVFETEPYNGNLIELDNCYISCHMGSLTSDCRAAMEIAATEEVCRYIRGESLKQLVPEEEYEMAV